MTHFSFNQRRNQPALCPRGVNTKHARARADGHRQAGAEGNLDGNARAQLVGEVACCLRVRRGSGTGG